MLRFGLRVAAVALLAVGLLPASAAFAHNEVIDTQPADGATVTEPLREVRVATGDEVIDLGQSLLEVRGPDGELVSQGCATVAGSDLRVPVVVSKPGAYTVEYLFTSVDGHPTDGGFVFLFEPTEIDEPSPVVTAQPFECPQVSANFSTEAPQGGADNADDNWLGGSFGRGLQVALLGVAALVAVGAVLVRAVRKSSHTRELREQREH